MDSSKTVSKNFYADLNVIYAYYDYLAPKDVRDNKKDIVNRRESIKNFISSIGEVKFCISKSVYIEWFQKMMDEENISKKSHRKFIKSLEYISLITKFKSIHTEIMSGKSIFYFEWNFNIFHYPMTQSWDHFHVTMKDNEHKFVTFDENFCNDKEQYVWLKKGVAND